MPQMVDLYAQGRFPFERIIKCYPFQQINDARKIDDVGTTHGGASVATP